MTLTRRIFAVALIFAATSFAWMILGTTLLTRTYSSDTTLRGKVASIWGAEQIYAPPSLSARDGEECIRLPLERTRAHAALNLEHRQKGLLWYATYQVDYRAEYSFRNQSGRDLNATFSFPLPSSGTVYDGLTLTLDGKPIESSANNCRLTSNVLVPDGAEPHFGIAFRSQGLGLWAYRFAEGTGQATGEAKDFELTVSTNFPNVDFPENTLAPTGKRQIPAGWELTWSYRSLMSGFPINVVMPEKLQPGPLAGEISYFAPVSLFFFFFLMLVITTLRGIPLHPMHYFFLAAAFFSFHLLLAYLADHISIHLAFVLCSTVSILLVVSYLRLITGLRFALVEAGLAQFVYLVLFSYAFFFKGFTGLAVTIGSILTLFFVMQLTGRVDWSAKFRPLATPPPLPSPGPVR
jgi:hypothetical protein